MINLFSFLCVKLQANAESSKVVDTKPRIVDVADNAKSWKLPEIVDSSHLKALRLPDPMAASKVYSLFGLLSISSPVLVTIFY